LGAFAAEKGVFFVIFCNFFVKSAHFFVKTVHFFALFVISLTILGGFALLVTGRFLNRTLGHIGKCESQGSGSGVKIGNLVAEVTKNKKRLGPEPAQGFGEKGCGYVGGGYNCRATLRERHGSNSYL
jgi:hypothetical protein